MDFSQVAAEDSMHEVTMTVASELRETLRGLYLGMYQRNAEFQGAMPNVVLAGLTLLWLEAVHTIHGTADYESALRLVKGLRPNVPEVEKEMRRAARDFLRRSRWLPKTRRDA